MLVQFSKHINTRFSFLKSKKLLVAISGGMDSVLLTHLLHELGYDIALAHCNFCLRGKDSDSDEVFVKQLADRIKVPVFTRSFDTESFAKKEKLSIQVAARELRYNWFDELIERNKLDYIVTAHHADDNLETFLINTIRGTGLDGLRGIPEKNNVIVRPLLPFSREEIEKYALDSAITWREDVSNTETKYLRNKLRHDVIPVLKEINPGLLASFNKTTENLKGSRQIIDDTIEDIKKTVVIPAKAGIHKINIEKLKRLSMPHAYLYELLKDYSFTEWNDVSDLLEGQSGKQVFSDTHRLVKDREFLLLTELGEEANEESYLISEGDKVLKTPYFQLTISPRIISDSKLQTSNFRLQTSDSIQTDKDLLKFPLHVRRWKKGDYFYPFGMTGRKKLSKFFKDEKLSLLEKENSWLLCSDNEVVWIIGKRLDNRYRITDKTKKILNLEYSE